MLNTLAPRLFSIYLCALLSLGAHQVLACDQPTPPTLPDAETAVTPQMIKAKNDVKAYVAEAQAFLDCTKSTKKHNKVVDQMNGVATQFNQVVRAYKARFAN